MLTFAQRRENLKRAISAPRREREVTAVACSVLGVTYGPAETLRHSEAEGYRTTTENVDGVLQERRVPVAWVKTNNRDALVYIGA